MYGLSSGGISGLMLGLGLGRPGTYGLYPGNGGIAGGQILIGTPDPHWDVRYLTRKRYFRRLLWFRSKVWI
jgi:hypothetical protein